MTVLCWSGHGGSCGKSNFWMRCTKCEVRISCCAAFQLILQLHQGGYWCGNSGSGSGNCPRKNIKKLRQQTCKSYVSLRMNCLLFIISGALPSHDASVSSHQGDSNDVIQLIPATGPCHHQPLLVPRKCMDSQSLNQGERQWFREGLRFGGRCWK